MSTVGVTERAAFRRCRLAWAWMYKDRLQLADVSSRATTVGLFVHEALAKYYTAIKDGTCTPTTPQEILAEVTERYRDALSHDRLVEAVELYERYMMHKLDFDWRIHTVEHEVAVKVPKTKTTLVGRIDLLISRNGAYWVVDHKTRRAYSTGFKLETDDQVTAYIWMLRKSGINVAGVLYNELGKRKTPPYVQVAEATRTERQLQTFEEDLVQEVRDMTSNKTRIYPSFGEHCGWCDMRSLCVCRTDKGNEDLIRQVYYQTKPPRGEASMVDIDLE